MPPQTQPTIYAQLADFLADLEVMAEPAGRRELLLSLGCEDLFPEIDWSGSPRSFVGGLLPVIIGAGENRLVEFLKQLPLLSDLVVLIDDQRAYLCTLQDRFAALSAEELQDFILIELVRKKADRSVYDTDVAALRLWLQQKAGGREIWERFVRAPTPHEQHLRDFLAEYGRKHQDQTGLQFAEVEIDRILAIARAGAAKVVSPSDEERRAHDLEQLLLARVDGELRTVQEGVPSVQLPLAVVDAADVGQEPSELTPAPDSLLDIFQDHCAGQMFIVGDPGTGKSYALRDLGRALVARAQDALVTPIPVYLHLSGWTPRTPLPAWFEDTIARRYKVGVVEVGEWLRRWPKPLFLLDGLDEMGQKHRVAFLRSLAEYGRDYGWSCIAVTCQTADFVALAQSPADLPFRCTVVVQPLAMDQIEHYLKAVGPSTDQLAHLIRTDEVFGEMAQVLRDLHLMSQTFLSLQAEQIEHIRSLAPAERKAYLLERYVAGVFERPESQPWPAPLLDIKRQLKWLAQKLTPTDTFVAEFLQPSWLASRSLQWAYLLVSRLGTAALLSIVVAFGFAVADFVYYPIICLVGGVVVATYDFARLGLQASRATALPLILRVINFLVLTLLVGAALGVVFGFLLPDGDRVGGLAVSGIELSFIGLFFGLVFGIGSVGTGYHNDIQNIEDMRLSWPRFFKGFLISGLIFGAVVMIYAILVVYIGQINNTASAAWIVRSAGEALRTIGIGYLLSERMNVYVFAFLFGLFVGGLIGGAYYGREITYAETGNWHSFLASVRRNLDIALKYAALFAFAWAAIYGWLFHEWPFIVSGLRNGVTIGAIAVLWFGGYDFIKHYSLRLLLYRDNYVPIWRYSRTLDHLSRIGFLDKGRGYSFRFPAVQKHIADHLQGASDRPRSKEWERLCARTFWSVFALAVVLTLGIWANNMLPPLLNEIWLKLDSRRIPEEERRGLTLHPHALTVVHSANRDDRQEEPIRIRAGDYVFIRAGGRLSTGPFAVRISPRGTNQAFIGLKLTPDDSFNIVPSMPNGALLCRIHQDGAAQGVQDQRVASVVPRRGALEGELWRFCGTHYWFVSQGEGTLEFEINDVEWLKHRGKFYVSVHVYRGQN